MQDLHTQPGPANQHHYPAWLAAGFVVSVIIALAAVLRRLTALVHPSSGGPAPMRSLDAVFSSHAMLTCFHIVPAAVFVCLSVVFYLRRNQGVFTQWLLYLFGAVTGVTAYFMSWYAIGGWVERSAVLVFNTWFLVSLAMSFKFYRRAEAAAMRRWMTRAVGVLLGIATARPVMGVFFATSARTHLAPRDFFGLAFWIGFSINTALIEVFLRNWPSGSSGRDRVGHQSLLAG
jgi:hypothetical protein